MKTITPQLIGGTMTETVLMKAHNWRAEHDTLSTDVENLLEQRTELLRELRDAGYTVVDAANMVGVSVASVYVLLRGTKPGPRVDLDKATRRAEAWRTEHDRKAARLAELLEQRHDLIMALKAQRVKGREIAEVIGMSEASVYNHGTKRKKTSEAADSNL